MVAEANNVSKPLQYCSSLGIWSLFRPRNPQRIYACLRPLCKSSVKAEAICISPRHRLNTAVRDFMNCIGTRFATAPEAIHRHIVKKGVGRLRGFPNKLGPRKEQYELESSPLETLRPQG